MSVRSIPCKDYVQPNIFVKSLFLGCNEGKMVIFKFIYNSYIATDRFIL